jgi:uncharacterized protein (DUF4213/DUF364 family)
MNIRHRIFELLSGPAADRHIQDARIGLGYTAVVLDNGMTGLAYTPHREMHAGCSAFPGFMPVKCAQALNFLKLIVSDYFIETAVGLATANALASGLPDPGCSDGDVLEIVGLNKDDVVGMIGHFAPLEGIIHKKAGKLIIFEQIDQPQGKIVPSGEIPRQLPDCTVALITATSLVNHSFENIIPHAQGCREVILLGASTPVLADVFSDTPITCLSGTRVTDVDEILRIVSFGGGTRMFKKCIRKINLRI